MRCTMLACWDTENRNKLPASAGTMWFGDHRQHPVVRLEQSDPPQDHRAEGNLPETRVFWSHAYPTIRSFTVREWIQVWGKRQEKVMLFSSKAVLVHRTSMASWVKGQRCSTPEAGSGGLWVQGLQEAPRCLYELMGVMQKCTPTVLLYQISLSRLLTRAQDREGVRPSFKQLTGPGGGDWRWTRALELPSVAQSRGKGPICSRKNSHFNISQPH